MLRSIRGGARVFSYAPLLGFAAAISFAKLIVYARLVGVADFGTLSKMLLVSSAFGMAASLGLQSVASREMPALLARGRERRAISLLARTIGVAAAVALSLCVAAAAGFSLFDLGAGELALGALHGFAQLAFLTVAFESRSRLEMMRYAGDMAWRNGSIAALGAGAAVVGYGSHGVVVAELLGTLACFVWLASRAAARARLSVSWLMVAPVRGRRPLPWRAALLMLAGAGVMFASFNLDRWIAAELLAPADFGTYAFAWLTLLAAQSAQALLNSGLLPLLSRRRALADEASAHRLTAKVSGALLAFCVLAAVPAAFALRAGVSQWMPAYDAAHALWLPLLLAAAFRVADFWSSLLIVVEREGMLLAVQCGAVIASATVYAGWLLAFDRSPAAESLAWLAAGAAILSHGASAVCALVIRPPSVRSQPAGGAHLG